MKDRKKSLGILLAGIGLFLLGISTLIFVFNRCTKRGTTEKEIISKAERLLNSPEMKSLMKDAATSPEKYASEVQVKEVKLKEVK